MPRYYDDSLNYDDDDDDDEEARYPLFRNDNSSSSSGSRRQTRTGGTRSNTNNSTAGSTTTKTATTNRVLVIVSLSLLVLLSIHFQSKQVQLTQQIGSDEQEIHKLQQTIKEQSLVINRFNSSVTNSDVVKRLTTLEYKLETSTKELHEELDQTVTNITTKLSQTMIDLEKTVQDAESEISTKVEQVKEDYKEFERKTNDQFSMENSFMIWQLAGTFTLLSCLISSWHMGAHFRNLEQPIIQRKILAILWMCPIYAVTSWFSLVFPQTEGYMAILKDSYEAYIIYQFLSFCISVLGKGDRERVISLLEKRASHLSPPVGCRTLFFCCWCFGCCKPLPYESDRALARAVLLQCQKFAMQFVFWRPATTIAKVFMKKYDYYGPWGAEDENDYRAPQFYIFLIENISIFLAFTGLLKFYHAVDKDLAWCRPFAKFLCIKGVVFMTFWQGLAISLLAQTLDETGGDPEEWATKTQNFLICLEMLLFSLAHYYCFPVNEWQPDYKVNYQKLRFGDSVALGDFFSDLKLVMKNNKRKHNKKRSKKKALDGLEEVDEENLEDDGSGEDRTYESEYGNDGTISDDGSLITTISIQTEDIGEVNEAQERLTKFLDDMAFTANRDNYEEDDGEDASSVKSPLRPSVFAAAAEVAKKPSKSNDTPTRDNLASNEHSENVTENTGLLSSPQKTSTPLNPSIFTTISDIAERSVHSGSINSEEDEQRYNC